MYAMTEEFWRPLGFDGDAAADYDVLNDGVPEWMAESFWQWVGKRFSVNRRHSGSSGWYTNFDPNLLRDVEQVCRIQAPYTGYKVNEGMSLLRAVAPKSGSELRVADYVLSLGRPGDEPDLLEEVLRQSGSRWTVGTRAGKPGLVRRVPEGAQVNAEFVMASAGQAGARLRQAWERAFGVSPDPTGAYALAVRAVEDAAVPVVVPKQENATLGHVIGQLRHDDDWSLPLTREHDEAPTRETVVRMCQALFKGHHDRHGGVPGAPETVSQEEAEAAVTLAVPLVQWFASGQVARRPQV